MQIESWLAFCSIALLATATPGPATLLVSTNSLMYGFKKSLITVLGNISGLLLMSSFSVLGLSAIVLNSAIAFTVLKIAGAIYLIYMGVNLWRKGITPMELKQTKKGKKHTISLYFQGILVSVTNPKAIVFTTALFPQFIVVSESLLPQFTVLVLSFMCSSFVCLSTYSYLARRAKNKTAKIFSGPIAGKVFGSTFIGAGCILASASR
ncbi:LysE family translocator [Microbulbifer sp. JMSA002]|uniref:LysE family translocator n=1 Tax=Microbulbifer sp. JMSA002 TaxID=3243368 RepID=UPI00403A67FC